MNTALQEFIRQHGGIFELEPDQHESVQSIINVIRGRLERHRQFALQHLYSEKPKPLQFELLNDTSLNAFAYTTPPEEQPGLDFIGLNVGILFTLSDIFSRILAHPDTFKDVGNPELEQIGAHDLPFLTTDILQLEHPPAAPVCPIRALFAGELAQIAIDFLFFHELTHLRNGHVDYLCHQLRVPILREAVSSNSRALDPMASQTLEIDADCGAILHTLNAAYQFRDLLKTPSSEVPKEMLTALTCLYGTGKLATRSVTFSTYTVFRLFDVSECAWEALPSLSHPVQPLRMFFIGSTLHALFSQKPAYEYSPDEFAENHAQMIFEAERCCTLICGSNPDMRGIDSVIRGDHYMSSYMGSFKAQWAALKPELEKYKRGGILAP